MPAPLPALPSPPPLCAQAGDAFATSRVATSIIRCCWEARSFKLLSAHLLALCKRRGQLKQAIMDIVQLAMTYIAQLPSKAEKEELIITLKTVTDGKIYAEVERARVTLALSALQEAEGRIAEASETLQECAVETFGSMDRKEKTDMLLEQVSAEGQAEEAHLCAGEHTHTHSLTHSHPTPTTPVNRCACAWRSATFLAWASWPTR